jgi:hypothetical protein
MEGARKPYEIGSEFHWTGLPKGECLPWPGPNVWFQTGRDAFVAIWKNLSTGPGAALLLPDYFCQEVADNWKQGGIPIRYYSDNPSKCSPEWESVRARPGDVVLAVNYFGVRDGANWNHWKDVHDTVILVEDHSHDPFSGWAINSHADYAFASIRKIFPVPDGAIVWSPRLRQLPLEPLHGGWEGSALKLAAMILKMDYLKGGNGTSKGIFRELQVKGESSLGKDHLGPMLPWSKILVSCGYPVEWRKRRACNVEQLISLTKGHMFIRPLFKEPFEESCPFNAVFLFPTKETREETRYRLIQNKVYPSVHWNHGDCFSKDSRNLSELILTVPVDQRYNDEDIRYIATILWTD